MNEMEIKRTPEVIGAEIRSLTTQARSITLWYGIEIGRRLTEAKEMVNHGEWLPFLEQQTDFSQPTASRFMRLYKEYGADQSSLFGAESKYSSLNNLSISNALRLLALPEDEREEFAAEHDLENKSTREVEDLIREKTALEQQLKEAKEGQALALAEAMAERDKLKEQLAAIPTEEEKAKLEEEIKALQARISMAAPEVAAFQAAFQRVQQEFNQMLEAMGKAPAESREKLRRAVNAMVDSFCQRVENI